MILLVLKLPVWFPGATFKRLSVKCLQAARDMKEIPFQYINERMVSHAMKVQCTYLTPQIVQGRDAAMRCS